MSFFWVVGKLVAGAAQEQLEAARSSLRAAGELRKSRRSMGGTAEERSKGESREQEKGQEKRGSQGGEGGREERWGGGKGREGRRGEGRGETKALRRELA